MPFCPKCKWEYNWGIGECSDCGSRLVEKLSDEKADKNPDKEIEADSNEYKDWIPLAQINNHMFFDLVVEGLKSKGIPAIAGSNFPRLEMWIGSRIITGGRSVILIPEKFKEDAIIEAEILLGENWDDAKLINI